MSFIPATYENKAVKEVAREGVVWGGGEGEKGHGVPSSMCLFGWVGLRVLAGVPYWVLQGLQVWAKVWVCAFKNIAGALLQ